MSDEVSPISLTGCQRARALKDYPLVCGYVPVKRGLSSFPVILLLSFATRTESPRRYCTMAGIARFRGVLGLWQ
jgi:hypothetical protein